jgi:YidC/Oxa1 family membrane protein insertase
VLLAANPFSWFMDPLVAALGGGLTAIDSVVHSYGWSMIVLAAVVRLFLWPLSAMQFKSMAEMQRVAPLLKQLQAKYKNEPQKLQQEQMALYKEHNVNPFAGCLPMLIPFPILIGLFYAINARLDQMRTEHWLWIGSSISHAFPHVFAQDLAGQDIFLLLLYVVSMYFTVRFGSPPSQDPQQAQTQKIMAFVSPAMIAYFGFQYKWASALYIYWLAMNVFTVAQQLWMYRKFGIGMPAAVVADSAPKNVTPPNENARKALKDGEAEKAPGNGKSARAKKRANR